MSAQVAYSQDMVEARKLREADEDNQTDSGDETTPTTTVSECSDLPRDDDDDVESIVRDADIAESHAKQPRCSDAADEEEVVPQLGPGLFPSSTDDEGSCEVDHGCHATGPALAPICDPTPAAESAAAAEPGADEEIGAGFTPQETLFVFDWDDTVLPSTWIQRQGLRLDSGSVVSPWQKERLGEVAEGAAEMLRLAKERGTVVLLTNAERGWIELSCQKFMPTLLPSIENVKIVSARTTYESPSCKEPLEWKVHAFEAEIARACGRETLVDPEKRKNIHSLGDSVHEREACMRATSDLPNCCTKSLKFVERPDISQIMKQHVLVTSCFQKVVQHDGDLDLCINC